MNIPAQQPPTASPRSRPLAAVLALGSLALSGCAVIAVADMAASAALGVAGLAVDAAVGTARIGGKVIGKTADVVLGSDEVPAE
ncbi:MAG: hypothetical protein C0443_02955 [Comamonadaceae bacterium]|nr:hypothetical protein [Comamonadaceae bacterium]